MKRKIIVILIILLCLCGYLGLRVYQKSRPTPSGAVTLTFPLRDGTFMAAVSERTRTRHTDPAEKYAIDIVRASTISDWLRFRNTNLEADSTYNTPIYSPCAGNIKKVIDGVADQPIGIGNPPAGVGNAVIIDCGNFKVTMAHIKAGTIQVKVGDVAPVGRLIARIGNSGNSDGPHLHIMAYFFDQAGQVVPLPILFDGRYLRTGDKFSN